MRAYVACNGQVSDNPKQELSLITGSLSDDATPDAIFASTGSLHLLS